GWGGGGGCVSATPSQLAPSLSSLHDPPPQPSPTRGEGADRARCSFWILSQGTRTHSALIPARAIAHVLERQPCLEALDLAQHVGDERARVGGGGRVRPHADPSIAP